MLVEGIIEQRIVCPPNGVFTGHQNASIPADYVQYNSHNIPEALTGRIKPTVLNISFTKILNYSPLTQELAVKKVEWAIVLATVPYIIEVLAYLHEFRVQNPHFSSSFSRY